MKIYKKITILFVSLSMICLFNIDVFASTHESLENPSYITIYDESGNLQIIDIDDVDCDDSQFENESQKNLEMLDETEPEIIHTSNNKGILGLLTRIFSSFHKTTLNTSQQYQVQQLATIVDKGDKPMVVHLKAKKGDNTNNSTKSTTLDSVDVNTGSTVVTIAANSKDAAFIGKTSEGKIRVMLAGSIMDFREIDVQLLNYEKSDGSKLNISYYTNKGGLLKHYYRYGSDENAYAVSTVGYALDYLGTDGTKWYSYDGHYFYKSYATMQKDYQAGHFKNAINAGEPYYNYFQFLSHRSITNVSAAKLDKIIDDRVGDSESKMKGLGDAFIEYQNTYSTNALLMFGVAINESAYGTSNIARTKNNLFGHNAVDSSPGESANYYTKVENSIKDHAYTWISKGYLDMEDYRFNGGHLGDKSSGMNVHYASDPYWGEKAAAIYYINDLNTGDYGKHTIGILKGVQSNYPVYKEANTSTILHKIGSKASFVTYNLPVLITGRKKDSNGNTWYRIQSDTALNATRTDLSYASIYSFTRDYYYVPESKVDIVFKGKEQVPAINVEDEEDKTETTYLPGDVNGDGKVTSLDYIQIKNHIMETRKLSGKMLSRADVNKDGKVTSLDYVKIKNHIMGTNPLF